MPINATQPWRRPGLCGAIFFFRFGRRKGGFSLVELLLVIIIMGIALGIAIPAFIKSLQGHRLRTAAHSVVVVSRYARNMALLKRTSLMLTFNLDSGRIDLISTNSILPGFSRVVEGVAVESVTLEGDDPVTQGDCVVQYRRNGVCRPFAVKIRDANGNRVVVKVDALSSANTVEFGQD
ncbi:MAG: prepilin-type N-terminal cleavage/methylation domain-containing protein [Lentisphaerae bacterium]|nr:prepilin-type N-terminal cleavage/methylation domain-containing protein [Lentisphaerota bacterium]